MKTKHLLLTVILPALVLAGAGGARAAEPDGQAAGADWPQFHGPRRNNLSTDTHLLKRWPDGGPKLIWQATGIGHGYATVAIAGGTIYTAGNIGDDTVITALDLSGNMLWQATNGPAYERTQPGARATPTVAGGKLYHLNGDGDVACLEAKTGKRVWTVNMLRKFGGRNIRWGLSESLLVDGRNVICCPGGEKIGLAALDKETGATVWTCTGVGDEPAYCSPTVIEHEGLRQIVTMMAASAVGVAADSGRLLWKYKYKVAYGANVDTPVYRDGHLALFGTWGYGATMLRLDVQGDRCSVEKVWHTKELDNEHGGVVLLGGYLYGHADGNHRDRHWACLDWKTGRTMYSVDGLPCSTGALTYADGMLYLLSERGTVALVPARPEAFRIVSRFELPKQGKGRSWAHPVVFGGRLYLRHGQSLYAYDVRDKARTAGAAR